MPGDCEPLLFHPKTWENRPKTPPKTAVRHPPDLQGTTDTGLPSGCAAPGEGNTDRRGADPSYKDAGGGEQPLSGLGAARGQWRSVPRRERRPRDAARDAAGREGGMLPKEGGTTGTFQGSFLSCIYIYTERESL